MDQISGNPFSLIMVGGAAAAFFWVLQWIVNGKLHSRSEVDGLRADKRELFTANKELIEANAEANKGIADVLRILADLPEVLILLNRVVNLLEEESEEGDT